MRTKARHERLYRWELALLLGVGLAALLGVWLSGAQQGLADRVVRLHVIANSDSEEDQALKLRVRDRVLEAAEGLYDPEADLEAACRTLEDNLALLARVGEEEVRRWGYDYPVTAGLEESWFPTKQYTDFALPAGEYTALKIVIGEGSGQNWWCVVFPPLCLGSVTESTEQAALAGGFSQGQVSLITGESEGYVVKFKAMELWEQCRQLFQ